MSEIASPYSEYTTARSDIIQAIYDSNIELINDKITNKTSPLFSVVENLRWVPILGRFLPAVNEKKMLIRSLVAEQKSAITYNRWAEISLQLDEVLGNNDWKLNPESNLYDYDLIFNNLQEMRDARLAKDYKLLLYLIRTKWMRNLGNMGNIDLYRHSHIGTKRLIEEYIEECKISLHYLISDEAVNLDDRYLLGMLIQTRKNIGRTALVLSGGSTFGIFHIGVLITLLDQNLLPRIVSGSSAGSIIASILCCHTNEETMELLVTITDRKFNIFGESDDDNQPKLKKLLKLLGHFIKYGTFFDISGLQETTLDFLGDLTFREAYNRTGKILNITVSPASAHEQTRLLNYLTAPNCLIWSAVCASCSLPGCFPSTSIYEKDTRTNEIHEWNNDVTMKYVDGSVDNDLPITRLLEMFNVDHIIAVQVNPHVIPMLKVSVSSVGGEIENEFNTKIRDTLNNCYDFVTSEIIHYLLILSELNIHKNLCGKLITLLSQSYSGDVTILPDLTLSDFLKIFENPTPEFLLDFTFRGARATWPKLTVIHNHCGVEFALDKAISVLRGKLITSSLKSTGSRKQNGVKDLALDNRQHYYTLVNSPVLNDDNSPKFEEKPKVSKSEYHLNRHLLSPSSTAISPLKFSAKTKRNSISSQVPLIKNTSPNEKITKGKSALSLTSLNHEPIPLDHYYREQRPEIISRTSEQFTNSRTHTEGYYDFPTRNQREEREQIMIRKARSSGNFYNDADEDHNRENHILKFTSERVPQYNNPYLESSLRKPSIEEDDIQIPDSNVVDEIDNKPNLPRRSHNGSLRNSYIGLSGLKDVSFANKSSLSSFATSLNNSRSNSSYNLKDHANIEVMKNLNSPDLRRRLTRSMNYEIRRSLLSDDEANEIATEHDSETNEDDHDTDDDADTAVDKEEEDEKEGEKKSENLESKDSDEAAESPEAEDFYECG